MAELQISPKAQKDLQGIKIYITDELDNPVAAQNTVVKITKAIRRLIDYPNSGAPLSSIIDIKTEYRFLVCENHLAFYRYDDGTVFVTRILYGRRNYMQILFGQLLEDAEN